jgi:hypothetical protein
MGYSTQWLFKGTVVYIRYFDSVSLEEISTSGLEILRLLDDMPEYKRASLILDGTQVHDYPRNLKALRNAVSPSVFARINWMILISDDYFQNHIASIFARLFNVRFHVSANLKDAYHFLQVLAAVPPPQDWPNAVGDTMPLR